MARLGKASTAAKPAKAKKAKAAPADKGAMFYEEKLDDVARLLAAKELALKERELKKLKANWKDTAAGHRADKKDLEGEIENLSDQVHYGIRKVPAQKKLELEERE
jgi:hypothetical protein